MCETVSYAWAYVRKYKRTSGRTSGRASPRSNMTVPAAGSLCPDNGLGQGALGPHVRVTSVPGRFAGLPNSVGGIRSRGGAQRARIVTLCALAVPAYHEGMDHLFLDESGNHSLNAYEPSYPVFVLGGVLIHEIDLETVTASVRAFKQDSLGDDRVVLHTADIARNRRGFEQLTDPDVRRHFYSGLNCLMAALPFSVIACAIDKPRLVEHYGALAVDPYALSLGIVVERFCFALGAAHQGRIVSFDFRRKDAALPGLELADLVVSPLGRLVAGMPNRLDTDIVVGKLRTGPDGGWEGAGLVVLPKKKGRGPLRSTRPRTV